MNIDINSLLSETSQSPAAPKASSIADSNQEDFAISFAQITAPNTDAAIIAGADIETPVGITRTALEFIDQPLPESVTAMEIFALAQGQEDIPPVTSRTIQDVAADAETLIKSLAGNQGQGGSIDTYSTPSTPTLLPNASINPDKNDVAIITQKNEIATITKPTAASVAIDKVQHMHPINSTDAVVIDEIAVQEPNTPESLLFSPAGTKNSTSPDTVETPSPTILQSESQADVKFVSTPVTGSGFTPIAVDVNNLHTTDKPAAPNTATTIIDDNITSSRPNTTPPVNTPPNLHNPDLQNIAASNAGTETPKQAPQEPEPKDHTTHMKVPPASGFTHAEQITRTDNVATQTTTSIDIQSANVLTQDASLANVSEKPAVPTDTRLPVRNLLNSSAVSMMSPDIQPIKVHEANVTEDNAETQTPSVQRADNSEAIVMVSETASVPSMNADRTSNVTPQKAEVSLTKSSPPMALNADRETIPVKNNAPETPKLKHDIAPAPQTNALFADMPKITTEQVFNPVASLTPTAVETPVRSPLNITTATMHTVQTHAQPALQAVTESIIKAHMSQSGVTVRLDPPEMGNVTINFQFETADRGVTAVVRSDVPETTALLRDRADILHQALKDSGFTNINLSFEQNDHNQNTPFDFDNTMKSASHLFAVEQAANDDAPLQTPVFKRTLGDGVQIDLKL